jgi:excisionase family DNA binding protein
LDLPKTGTVLGVSRSAVFELLRSGLLPAVKLGRRTLVRKSDLERFIANLATANYRPPSIKPNPKRMRRCG